MNVTKAWAAQLDDYVIDLSWSPDGRLLASASAAGPITVFDGLAGTRLHEFAGHEGGTNAVAFDPALPAAEVGGRKSELGGQKSEVGGQRSEVGNQRSEIGSQMSEASDLTSALLASGGQDGSVRLWNASGGRQIGELETAPGAWVERVQWKPMAENPKSQIPNPNLLAVAAGRKLLFANADGSVAHVFPDAPKTLSALAWHPKGGAIAAAHFGGVVLWDAVDFRVQRQFAYSGAIPVLVWSPDGRWLVAGGQDKAVHLWIPEEDQEFHMSGYETKVGELSFSSDSRWLATGGSQDACIWDCSGAGPEGRDPMALPHSARVCAVAFQRANGLLATAANDGEVALWNIRQPEPRVATIKLTAPASSLAWSPDDALLAIGSQKGGVLVLRVNR
jgi:WD40 repeat protein